MDNLDNVCVHNFLEIWKWKNCVNWSTFAKVVIKKSSVLFFFWDTVAVKRIHWSHVLGAGSYLWHLGGLFPCPLVLAPVWTCFCDAVSVCLCPLNSSTALLSSQQLVLQLLCYFQNLCNTRKRGKAQRVARPAYAKATVHFYRLAMLLPSSELHLKTSTQRTLAYVDSSPLQMSQKISVVTGSKFTKQICSRSNFFHRRC